MEKLLEIRKRIGLTQSEAAKKLGVSQQSVAKKLSREMADEVM